jgi:hypothetical protein
MKPNKYFKVRRHKVNDVLNTDHMICCVYFLLKKGVVVYIGMTHNLRSRITNHKSSLCHSRWFDSFRFIECDYEIVSDYEKRLIRIFKPIENRHHYHRFKELV